MPAQPEVVPAKSPRQSPTPGDWPRITIVTPSYNQGQYLDETIRSVLEQGYSNLEYIIMDGGSTDESVAIIRRHEASLAYWTSAKDNGQADAIARGFERASGEIFGYVNSDDLLLPGSLARVAEFFQRHQEAHCVTGGGLTIDSDSQLLCTGRGMPLFKVGVKPDFRRLLLWKMDFYQPATFWRQSAYAQVGGFDRSLRFCFDYDLFFRLAQLGPFGRLWDFLAAFRLHDASKTSTLCEVANDEAEMLRRKFGKYEQPAWARKTAHFYYCNSEVLMRRWMQLLVLLKLKRLPWPPRARRA